jgi:hypothetical protein
LTFAENAIYRTPNLKLEAAKAKKAAGDNTAFQKIATDNSHRNYNACLRIMINNLE